MLADNIVYARGSIVASATTTSKYIQVVSADMANKVAVRVWAFRMKRSSGTAAANFTPTATAESAPTNVNHVGQICRPSSAVAVGTMADAPGSLNYVGRVDTLGRIYLFAFPDVAGDTFDYEIYFSVEPGETKTAA